MLGTINKDVIVLTISVLYLVVSSVKLQEISHEVEDEEVMEGDIIGFTKFNKKNNKLLNNSNDYGENAASTSASMSWPGGVIPYEISSRFSNQERKLILEMMAKIQNVSCVRFKIHHAESTYMEILHRPYKQCRSFIGYEKKSGPRLMYLQSLCMNEHDIMHELMHALGFFHEHNRVDRDNFVIIHYENIQPIFVENFIKRDFKEYVLIGTNYDFSSVTHYPKNANAIDPRSPTIESRHGEKIKPDGLTEQDILKINRFYKCSRYSDSLSKTLVGSLQRSPLNQLCPDLWTFDSTYPNICYRHNAGTCTWYDAANFCHRLNPQATLPIFHDLSEYISYSKWANERSYIDCTYNSWLGISYNFTSKNYSWMDGSDVSFNFYDHDMVFEESYSFYHYIFGSNKWKQRQKTNSFFSLNVCQLRINKNSLLKITTKVSLGYPKSRKCPQKENWFYDNYSNICYYYDRHDSRNWTSAFAHCKSEVGGSLPYFMTENEFDSFVKLIRTLHIPCGNDIWLGYYRQNYSFVNVNGSANSFLKWFSGYPKIRSDISYVYFYWSYNAFKNEDSKWTTKNVFCQCRSRNCKTEKIAKHHFSSII